MDGSLSNYDPQNFNPYFRTAAGWVEPKELTSVKGKRTVSCNLSDVLKYTNPNNDKEYFLIENRRKKGHDKTLPGEGFLIWRCNEEGTNTTSDYIGTFSGSVAEFRRSNELSLEQADGAYQLERYGQPGQREDFWYAENPSKSYLGRFNDVTAPCAKWADGSESGLQLSCFSAVGDTMSFYVGDCLTVEVEFDANGGQLEKSFFEYVVGSPYGFLPVPIRSGYRFTGWQTVSKMTVVEETTVALSSVTKLTATWQAKSEKEFSNVSFGKGDSNWPSELFLASEAGATTEENLFSEGGKIFMYAGYRNSGMVDTPSAFFVRFKLMDVTRNTIKIYEYHHLSTLQANSAIWNWGKNGSEFGILKSLTAGQYILRAELDADGDIDEYDESDNVREIAFTVGDNHTVNYRRGAYGFGVELSNMINEDCLVLEGATFVRDGYVQTGWSSTYDGKTKAFNLSDRYEGKTSLTLYPYWTVTIIPELATDATPTAVARALEAAGFVDLAVKDVIGGSAEEYDSFVDWARSVKVAGGIVAGEAAVVVSPNAAVSYLLGAETLIEGEPTVEIAEVEIDDRQTSSPEVTLSVTVRDGENEVRCAAEKVAAMFEATSDLNDWSGDAKLTPNVVVLPGDGNTMRFKVMPGDGSVKSAFLRIRR